VRRASAKVMSVRVARVSVALCFGCFWYTLVTWKRVGYVSQAHDDTPLLLPLTRRQSEISRVLQNEFQLESAKLSQPLQLSASKKPPEPSTAPLTNIGNTQYSVHVGIGTPPQYLEVLIDTGSSDLWMAPKKFRVAASSTLRYPVNPMDQQRMINYGQGQVAGDLFFDDVVVGNARIEEQSFLTITHETKSMSLVKTDGVLGLGPPALSNSGETVLQNLQEQRNISTFALLLCDNIDGSTLVLGMPPADWYIPRTLVYTPAVTGQWWAIDGALVVGGVEIEQGPFLLDSGTSFLSATRDNYYELVKQILPPNALDSCSVNPTTLRVICPCSFKDGMKSIAVRVGTQGTFDIPKDLFFAPTTGEDRCVLEVQPIANGSPLILGDTFLKGVVAMFDSNGPDGPRIRLAKRGSKAPACSDGLDWRRKVLLFCICCLSAWLVVELAFYLHERFCPHRCQWLQEFGQKSQTQIQEPMLPTSNADSGARS